MPPSDHPGKRGKPSKVILIAEDHDELRNYLVSIMNERYLVLSAKNGRQALEISREVRPDLIITDILMPGLDGVNLLKQLKSDRNTKPIPVMMLTALHEQDYQLESMRGGADSYLVKPVDESILFAQIENIFARQSVLAESLDNGGQVDIQPRELRASFVQTAERIIEKNLQNSTFSPKDLAQELKISRSTLYRKIKQTSDENSSEFIRNVRLRQAIKLMKTGNYNLNEIGFIVGFNSTSYFNRSFKKKYGMTPKEYLKQLQY
ncbi:MAG: response regulator [Saprospiraceae bacterium]|nr:response regulator [Saprospiraceae bacterium]